MKDGYGVFIFDDGHTYEGMFQKDRPADPVAFKERGDETMQVGRHHSPLPTALWMDLYRSMKLPAQLSWPRESALFLVA